MKLNSDASMLYLTHDSITNFASLSDFDKKITENLPRVYKNAVPAIDADATNSITPVTGASISSILASRLITAVNAAKCYGSIARVTTPQNMACTSVFPTFKIDHEAYLSVKDEDDSKVPKINDRENDRNIIR